jgi:hypothetical protein
MEGSFSFETTLCRLFRTDISDRLSRKVPSKFDDYIRILAASSAKSGSDFLFQSALPTDLPDTVGARLYHERLHWWQLVSYPLMQSRFLLHLQQLRIQVRELGGQYRLIGGFAELDEPGDTEQFNACLEVADTELYWNALTPDMVQSFDCIAEDPYTCQVFFYLPANSITGGRRPAYGAMLGFGPGHDIVHIAFTAQSLLESAAYISQLMFEGQEPPVVESLDDVESRQYLGPWEYWRRLHGRQYCDRKSLAIAFLAVIDLAMMADLTQGVNPTKLDAEYYYERVSIPYRFGKLAYRLQTCPPLTITDTNILDAVRRYQELACERCSWPSVRQVGKEKVIALTRALLFNCAFAIEDNLANRTILEAVYRTPVEDIIQDLTSLEPAWKLIREVDGRGHILGQQILESMLNACVLRTLQPSYLAAAFAYSARIMDALPLPVVLYEGQYYSDVSEGATIEVHAEEIFSVARGLARESIELLVLLPLRKEKRLCGFIDVHADCDYMQLGFGCPYKPLTQVQRTLREELQLDDYCHYTDLTIRLNIEEQELAQRRKSRRKTERGAEGQAPISKTTDRVD